jgi:predicted metal-dependent HD superfamily phosphohydrolase
MREKELETQWLVLAADLKMSPVKTKSVLDLLVKAYNEPHRCYHTVNHIVDGLNVMQKLPYAFDRTQKIAFIFHDVVYDVKSATNEEDSVKVAMDCLMENMCKEEFQLLKKYIISTKHDAISREAAKLDTRVATFLDVDLFSLGSFEYEGYKANYAKLIAMEYVRVYGLENYSKGRLTFVKQMLKCDYVYHSDYVRKILDKNAKKNLALEMNDLSKVKIDL